MDGGGSAAATPAATPPATEAAPAKEPVAAPATASAPAPVAAAPAPKPAAKPAAAEKPAPAAGGKFRVQLGAFSSEDTARAEWRRATGRFAELKSLSPLVTAAQTGSGKLYRLQTSLASEASARDLCARLMAGGQACIYVPVRN
jgi:cell division septation protein DedD